MYKTDRKYYSRTYYRDARRLIMLRTRSFFKMTRENCVFAVSIIVRPLTNVTHSFPKKRVCYSRLKIVSSAIGARWRNSNRFVTRTGRTSFYAHVRRYFRARSTGSGRRRVQYRRDCRRIVTGTITYGVRSLTARAL